MKAIVFHCGVAISLVAVCAQISLGKSLAGIEVKAGDYTRIDTPVSVELPVGMSRRPLALWETTGGTARYVLSQIEQGDPVRLWWKLNDTTPAGTVRKYEVRQYDGSEFADETDPTTAVTDESVMRLMMGNNSVLEYHHAAVPIPEGVSDNYARSAFIHPVYSPSGHVLTEMQPDDHLHHMGIWMPWTKTEFEGRRIDFWNLGKNEGTVRFKMFASKMDGPIYSGLVAEHEHIDLTAPGGEKAAINEEWDVRVYNVGGPGKGYWFWDLKSTQRCASESPLRQLKYHYSGQGFRATKKWKGANRGYLTSEGRTRIDADGSRARWCDCYGSFGSDWAGIAIMSHPQNFRHPEPMRIWAGEDYYVYMGFVPSLLGEWTMEPGKDYVFRYRFLVHDGKPSVEQIERIWQDYAEPPAVKLQLEM